MFNFTSDASAVSMDQSAGFDRNVTSLGWTAFFDTNQWVLVVGG
ncbi:hypothetical protein ACLESD_10155 [Pyxidicoccus sp. 3LFB2]